MDAGVAVGASSGVAAPGVFAAVFEGPEADG